MSCVCGCRYTVGYETRYLPHLDISAHAEINSSAYKTILAQNFVNSSPDKIQECTYVFPVFDGVSVIAFTCDIGARSIKGVVKEKLKARKVYDDAVERGETAGFLEQGPTGDVFAVKLGNIPAGETLVTHITYVGDLKHDIGLGGIRYTLPSYISPRYGNDAPSVALLQDTASGISVTVDISMPSNTPILNVRSPSHPIELTLGRTSISEPETPRLSLASAKLALGTSALDKDFVLEIVHKDNERPKALLERHSDISGQRALMISLIPHAMPTKGPPPEVIVVADQSGSMQGTRTKILVSALRILLKSLPVETKFNICAFGSSHKLLWAKSQHYDAGKLQKASDFVSSFNGDYGGTETFAAVKAAINSRDKDRNLALILATDGDICAQHQLFQYLNEQVAESKTFIRVFPLGIGNSVSSSLIEGAARAGNGFAQTVGEGEKQDAKIVRMLKGALTPDTGSWTMEIKFEQDDDDYVHVERVADSLRVVILDDDAAEVAPIRDENANTERSDGDEDSRKKVMPPKILQSPQVVPPLYLQTRSTLYLLLSPSLAEKVPQSITIRNDSSINPFEISIPVEHLPEPGTTFHSLAAKRAILELEEGRGWLNHAFDPSAGNKPLKETSNSIFPDLVKAECVRLGEQYQIASKHTAFVAIESGATTSSEPTPTLSLTTARRIPTLTARVHHLAYAGSPSGSYNPLIEESLTVSPQCYMAAPTPPHSAVVKARSSSARFTPRNAKSATPKKLALSSMMPSFLRNRRAGAGGGSQPHQQSASMDAGHAPLPAYCRNSSYEGSTEREEEGNAMDRLITLQTFEGYWEYSDKLLKVIGVDQKKWVEPKGVEKKVWATVLAVVFLELQLKEEKESWEMVVEKARTWLEGQGYAGGKVGKGDGIVEAVWDKATSVFTT